MKCSSWVHVNSGTSGRSVCAPCGLSHIPSVLMSNSMAERTGVSVLVKYRHMHFFCPKFPGILDKKRKRGILRNSIESYIG